MTAHGHFHWNELMTRDAEKAKDFYGKTLGWTYHEMTMMEGMSYWVCMDGEQPIGGIFTMNGPDFEGVPEHWFPYIAVDDVDARLEKLKAEGGQVRREPFDMPGVGRIAIVTDSNGAASGWMTPADQG